MYVVYAFLAMGRFVYVGSTLNIRSRKSWHKGQSDFYKDFPNGCFVILEANIPKSEIKEREEYWIAEYKVYYKDSDYGYNKTRKYKGVDSKAAEQGQLKRFEDPKEREKLRQATLKRFEDPKERERLSVSILKSYREYPERRKRQGESISSFYQKNPDRVEKMRLLSQEAAKKRVLEGSHHWVGRTWRDHSNTTPETRNAYEHAKLIEYLHFCCGCSLRVLAKDFSVGKSTIGRILRYAKTLTNDSSEQMTFF